MITLFITTLILWVFFIATAKVSKGAEQLSDLNVFKQLFVITFVTFDVLYNIVYGSILFLQLPSLRRGEKTLTARLKKNIKNEGNSWRGKLSIFMCKYMIEPWDVGHCKIN